MNYEEIKRLIDDMGNSKLDSLDIEFPDGVKIKMTKNEKVQNEISKTTIIKNENNCLEQNKVETNLTVNNNDEKMITSPMVGTFYASSSPKDAPFVKIGDKIKKGDIVCIIEAMKLMNEIESEYEGEIVEICVKNEQMVEYGTPLFKIRE